MMLTLSNRQARRLLLHLQGLSQPPRRKLDRDGLATLIEDLGYVQVDSINTVVRAHHLILFARNQTYRPVLLERLLERDRALFENWTHDAAIIPCCFFPYWQYGFAREAERLTKRWQQWHGDDYRAMLQGVLDHVHQNGPVMARHLGTEESKSAGGWWEWHPTKTALEYHWRTGALAVTRRLGFQKVYDLTERVIPEQHRNQTVEHEAFLAWACRSALDRLGVATPGEIADFWGLVSAEEAKAWCTRHLGQEVTEVLVEPVKGARPRKLFARPDLENLLGQLPEPPGRLRVLSPFDPLIRNRRRTEQLFDFDYRIEVFVPAPKRRYGYYVFPLLEGDRFVGRIDMNHDCDSGVLQVKSLWPEARCRWTKGRQEGLEAELERLRRFTGADRISFDQTLATNPAASQQTSDCA